MFLVWKLRGISEDNDDQFSLVGSSRSPLVPHLGLILSSHSFCSLLIGEGVIDSSVVTRRGRVLGVEKLPITRVVSSLVSISLPNKGGSTLRDQQKLVGKYLSIPATKKYLGESFSSFFFFFCSTQNGTGLGGEGSGVGG